MLKVGALRLGAGLIQILIALTVIFFAVRAVPGDPAVVITSSAGGTGGGGVTSEALERVREALGLAKPLHVQYFDFILNALRGDFGQSFKDGSNVSLRIIQTLPNTFELVLLSAVLGVTLGILLGSWLGRGGRVVQFFGSGVTSLGLSVPVYVLGSLMVLVFALNLGWLPSGGFVSFAQDPGEHFRRLILPAVTLCVAFAAIVARMTASSVREVAQQDWVRTARSVGLARHRVFRADILRNAINPVMTIVGLEVGALLGGTVLVERIFNWPGISSLLVEAIYQRDYPVVQGVVAIVSILFIAINIIVDLVNRMLDPRLVKA